MSKLTQDCLIIIFEELEYDVKSLYSCLLINKLWCETVVPVLWKNPWKFLKNNKRKIIRLSYLHRTITSFLPPEIKFHLINRDINTRKPLFKYISYLKTLKDTNIMVIAQNTHDENTFIRELFKMIFNYSPNIKKLIIFSNYVDQELCNIPESHECFLNITTLKCNAFVKLDKLAQICHNIRYLSIKYCNYDNPGLITLIKSQKNLQYFKCGFRAFSDPYEISCKGIGEALTKKAHSILLIHITCSIKFYCPIFTKFVNLKTLKIDGKIVDNSLMKPNLPNLEYLELYGGYIYEAAIFIKSTKGNLREIRIKHDFHEKNRLMFIQSITQYCPNIKSVALFYQDDHLIIRELEKLFSSCSQLERLVIVSKDHNNDSYDKLLDILVIHAPSSLNSLKLDNFKIKMERLKTFFKRWKDKHQTSISVYYILYFKEIHKVDIINDCVEVKKFDDNYCCRYFDWN